MTSAAAAATMAHFQDRHHQDRLGDSAAPYSPRAENQESAFEKSQKSQETQGSKHVEHDVFFAQRNQRSWVKSFDSSRRTGGRRQRQCFTCQSFPTDIPLGEMAMKTFGKTFDQLDKFDGTMIIRQEFGRARCLLNPGSPGMQRWGVVVLVALLFTSVMTPFEVAFIEPSMGALFVVNRLIDLVFVADMIFNFLLMYKITTPSGTIWVKDHRLIAKRYAKSWLMLDIISILPFDITSLLNSDTPILSHLKGLRVIRAFRMLKLVRMMKAAKFVEDLQKYVAIAFAKMTLAKVGVGLFCVSHWMACFWGMLGKLVGTSLECKPDSHEPTWTFDDNNNGVSWISAHYSDGHKDSPCNPFHLYASSLHFSTMTITSIGHGDINPQRVEEYFCGCVCQLIGAITWAITIGKMSAAICNLDPQANYFEGLMDQLNYMMEDEEMPQHLKIRLREHFNEYQDKLKNENYLELKDSMSQGLVGDVILQENHRVLRRIWYFKHCHRDFMVHIATSMVQVLYAPRELVQAGSTLWMIRRGVVAYPGKILVSGQSWGEDVILTCETLRYTYYPMAVTYTELSGLHRRDLFAALQEYPIQWKWINKARCKMAIIRGIILAAKKIRILMGELTETDRSGFLTDVFTQAALTNLIITETQGDKDDDEEDASSPHNAPQAPRCSIDESPHAISQTLASMRSTLNHIRGGASDESTDKDAFVSAELIRQSTFAFDDMKSASKDASEAVSKDLPQHGGMNNEVSHMREAADASRQVSDQAPLPPDTQIADDIESPFFMPAETAPEVTTEKNVPLDEAEPPVEADPELEDAMATLRHKDGSQPVTSMEFPKLPDITTMNQQATNLNPTVSLADSTEFPKLPETLQITAQNPKKDAYKEPVKDAPNLSSIDIQRLAEAIARKIEQNASTGEGSSSIQRSTTMASLQSLQGRQVSWRLEHGDKRLRTM